MKKILFVLSIAFLFSCKNNAEPTKDNQTAIENIDDQQDTNTTEPETYLRLQINGEQIKDAYGSFTGGGSKASGLISKFTLEVPKGIFGEELYEIKFNHTKKTLPPSLNPDIFTIKGFESDQDYFENNKENAFYSLDALTMGTYKKMVETFGKMDKEAFLNAVKFDFVVIPDPENKLIIASMEEVKGAKEFTEISNGKGIRKNEFLVEGKLHLKLLKVASKEEFIITSAFKTIYEYEYTDL